MDLIKFENVEKSFGKRKVIRNLNFSIRSSEIIALVGTNGAGKTTAIRMMLGITAPDKGTISRWTKKFTKEVGAQLQTTPFFEGHSVEDNLKLFGVFYQMDLSEEQISSILKRNHLSDARKTIASKLSLGQQKRLAISITTLHDPAFVVLDEPSAGLDPGGKKDVQLMIQHLKTAGKTVLFSSHDMLEVRNVADRILLMDKGEILEDGAPAVLLEKYQAKDLEEVFYQLTREKEEQYV